MDGYSEIARLTTVRGRVLITAYAHDTDGTYAYRGEGCGGTGHTSREYVMARVQDAQEWPGGKTARLTTT